MIDDIYKTYLELFSPYNVYLKYFRVRQLVILTILFIIAIFNYRVIGSVGFIFVLAIFMFAFLMYLKHEKKLVIENKYKLSNEYELKNQLLEKFKNYFINKNIDLSNREQFSYLSMVFDKEINSKKPKHLISQGVATAVFAPIWVFFVESYINLYSYDFGNLLISALSLLVFALVVYFYIKFMTSTFSELIFTKYYRLMSIRDKLEEIHVKTYFNEL
jgi:hypothetical protein